MLDSPIPPDAALLDAYSDAVTAAVALSPLSGALAARLSEADSRVDASTELAGECLWGAKMAKRMKWSPRDHWWYWRRPRVVAVDFEGGA